MIKKIMGIVLASTLILSGCASTEQHTYVQPKSFNNDITKFFANNRDASYIRAKIYSIDSDKFTIDGNKTSAIYKEKDFLNLIKDKDIKVYENHEVFIGVKNSDKTAVKSTINRTYISSLEEKIVVQDDGEEVKKTEYTLDNVEYGLNLIIEYLRKQEILDFQLNLSRLVNIENVFVTEKEFIQVPTISSKNYKTQLRVKDDSIFVQNDGDRYFVLAILKHDELKLQNIEQTEQKNIKEPVVIVENVKGQEKINTEFNEIDLKNSNEDDLELF